MTVVTGVSLANVERAARRRPTDKLMDLRCSSQGVQNEQRYGICTCIGVGRLRFLPGSIGANRWVESAGLRGFLEENGGVVK
jgi:hypothetical protein